MHTFTIVFISTFSLGVYAASIGDSISQLGGTRPSHNADFVSGEPAGKPSQRRFAGLHAASVNAVSELLGASPDRTLPLGAINGNTRQPQVATVNQNQAVSPQCQSSVVPASAIQPQVNPASAIQPQVNPASAIQPQVNPASAIQPQVNPASVLQPQVNSDTVNAPQSDASVTRPNAQNTVNSADAIGINPVISLNGGIRREDAVKRQIAIPTLIPTSVPTGIQLPTSAVPALAVPTVSPLPVREEISDDMNYSEDEDEISDDDGDFSEDEADESEEFEGSF